MNENEGRNNMEIINFNPQTPAQIQENRELLSCLLSSAERICDIASEEIFIANFFGMSKTDFSFLWYEISKIREMIEGKISIYEINTLNKQAE